MKPTICVDLNGVLDTYTGWDGGKWYGPRPGAGDFLYALRNDGYEVVILTTRDATDVWHWLEEHEIDGLVYDVTSTKPPAIAYVDDRAVCFRGNFDATLAEVRGFKAHWEEAET